MLRAIAFFVLAISPPSVAAAQSKPPIPYEDVGACPFECCSYRTWTVEQATNILKDRRDGSSVLFSVKHGDSVEGVTGVVVTSVAGRAVVKRETQFRGDTLKPGQEIMLLHYKGEGFWLYWYKGNIDDEFFGDADNCSRATDPKHSLYAACAIEVSKQPTTVWWAKIRNKRGQEGWTRQVDHFGHIDACGAR